MENNDISMNQQPLWDDDHTIKIGGGKNSADDTIKSLSFDQRQLINDIISLHIPSGRIEYDPTYSTGSFYRHYGVQEPLYKSDISPQVEGCDQQDVTSLTYQNESFSSIMYDPPFVIGRGPSLETDDDNSKIIRRFSSFNDAYEMHDFYTKSLKELSRVLKKDGVLIFKCQDTVSGGKQFLSHVFIINEAEKHGLYTKDLFILGANNVIISQKIKKQQHARKYHSYFIVFVKKENLTFKYRLPKPLTP